MDISDIIKKIILYLPINDKINILSISKFHCNLIKTITYDEPVLLSKIIRLTYLNNFTNIIVDSYTDTMPNN